MTAPIHLHGGWNTPLGAKLLIGLRRGISLCNMSVSVHQLTSDPDAVTCHHCLERIAAATAPQTKPVRP
jgi:hypothetical protein